MNVCLITEDFQKLSRQESDFVFSLEEGLRKLSWETKIATFKWKSEKSHENEDIEIIEIPENFFGEKEKVESYSTYKYLKEADYDLVLIVFSSFIGYFPSIANRQGLYKKCPVIFSVFPEVKKNEISNFKDYFENSINEFLVEKFHEYCDFVFLKKGDQSKFFNFHREEIKISGHFDLDDLNNNPIKFIDFCENIVENYSLSIRKPKKSPENKRPPLVSVCIVNHNRHYYLPEVLNCFENQTYKNFEVILVDDGSTDENTLKYLTELEETFTRKNWKIIRQENKYLGAARNEAVRHASGDLIVFADDDNYPQPRELETFVRAMEESGADILTSGMEIFFGEDVTKRPDRGELFGIPLGPCIGLGFLENVFGDANCCIRKSAFQQIGGFTEDYGIGFEDWEFFAKAALRGYDLQVVPESLFFYRMHGNSMSKTTKFLENRNRSLRPYLEETDPSTAEILKTASSIYLFQKYRHLLAARNRFWFVLLKILKEEDKARKMKYFLEILLKEGPARSLKVFSLYLSQ